LRRFHAWWDFFVVVAVSRSIAHFWLKTVCFSKLVE
jgi:hypothetical protein